VATLVELKRRALRLIGEPEASDLIPVGGARVGADLLLEAICAGLDAILPWVSQSKVATLTGDGERVEFDLPTDLYRIESVYDAKSKEFIPMARMIPRQPWADVTVDMGYLEYPDQHITFSRALSTDGGTIYYSALWTKPTADDSPISAPLIAHTGIVLFATAYCLLSLATQVATIRPYNTRTDSGTPEDNPIKDMADYYQKWFETEMNRHPAKMRGQQ